MRSGIRVLILCIAHAVVSGAPALHAQVNFLVADTYYADGDLKKPSAFTIMKSDTLWLTKFDAAAWIQTGWRALILDVGAAAALGSARNESTRAFYPLISGTVHTGPLLANATTAYETTTDSKVAKTSLLLRSSPLLGPAIGVPVGRNPDFRWRPWIGYQIGRVHNDTTTLEGDAGANFGRWFGAVEALLRIKRSSAADAPSLFELSASGNVWYLAAAELERHQIALAAAYRITPTVWIQLKYDYARKPPVFAREETVILAIGVRR